ncbi:LysR family transcriptional regulator [Coraliomargarita sp. SDUM461003]|uniref:LysR family transcriptional regulator n=1 Tax=Thalassobacterium maritimum TaxID=3041265 RepID=A0ABU1AS37_9BACT|nr:LysR family transcriptional regulator [Coraliomargarita sp. SDUM461003]MDQ8206432.1 LysR family transcriptional regulator [Coraliomargarita sp. SDUM461003]
MEIQQIRYFLAVAELRNFTRAAERCHVAQPSLSQQIKKLEQELGGALFHRMGRRILLTEQGELLESKAKTILLEHENAIQQVSDSFQCSRTVTLGAIMTIAPYLVPALLHKLTESECSSLRIEENFTETLIEKVRRGRLDFAIMSSPLKEPDLLVQVLGHERFLAVMPKEHPLNLRPGKVTLDELVREPFLELNNIHCAGKQINEICRLSSGKRNTVFLSSQIETIRRLVLEGKGVTILPQMSLHGHDDMGIKEIEGMTLEREITLVQHPDRYLSKSAQELKDKLKAFTQQYLQAE